MCTHGWVECTLIHILCYKAQWWGQAGEVDHIAGLTLWADPTLSYTQVSFFFLLHRKKTHTPFESYRKVIRSVISLTPPIVAIKRHLIMLLNLFQKWGGGLRLSKRISRAVVRLVRCYLLLQPRETVTPITWESHRKQTEMDLTARPRSQMNPGQNCVFFKAFPSTHLGRAYCRAATGHTHSSKTAEVCPQWGY